MIKERKRYIVLSELERSCLLNAIKSYRQAVIDQGKNPELINEVLIKVAQAPMKKIKVIDNVQQR